MFDVSHDPTAAVANSFTGSDGGSNDMFGVGELRVDAHPLHDWLLGAVGKRLREKLAKLQVEIKGLGVRRNTAAPGLKMQQKCSDGGRLDLWTLWAGSGVSCCFQLEIIWALDLG